LQFSARQLQNLQLTLQLPALPTMLTHDDADMYYYTYIKRQANG